MKKHIQTFMRDEERAASVLIGGTVAVMFAALLVGAASIFLLR